MFKRASANFALFLLLADIAWSDVALYVAGWLRLSLPIGIALSSPEFLNDPWWAYILVAMTWATVFLLLDAYSGARTLRAVDDIQRVMVAASTATMVFAGVAYFLFRDLSRILFIYFFLTNLIFLVGWRLVLRAFFRIRRQRWPHTAQRVLIAGVGEVGRRIEGLLEEHRSAGIVVVGYLDDNISEIPRSVSRPVLGTLSDAGQVIREQHVDELIVALPLRAHGRLVDLVTELHKLPVRIHVVPDLFDLAFARTTIDDLGGIPLIGLRDPAIEGFPRLAKRSFDLVVSGIALVILTPLMAVIALAIKLDDPGPVFFWQQRVGDNGKLFWMWKFRSMCADAEERLGDVLINAADGQVVHKQPGDPRVTRVGKFLRGWSLDELPQLINVLKGEMSLVGPRPELPWLAEKYEPWQRTRFAVPQGITGWWQVNGRSDKPMHLHVDEDLYYIQNYSLLLDIRILWRTLGAVLKRTGAY